MAVQVKEHSYESYNAVLKNNFEKEALPEPHFGYFFLKRAMDIVCSLIAVVVLSPVLLLTFLAVRLTSPGKSIYTQIRVGKNGKYFTMYKFRSMYVDADKALEELKKKNEMDGPVFKMKHDPRITPVGHFIRKFSIDELPQLFNILLGDMSIVGPRPALPKEVMQYSGADKERLLVKPGLTCIWQVSGRSDVGFNEWMEMDREYIRKRSILFDILLILKTIPAVILGKGAC